MRRYPGVVSGTVRSVNDPDGEGKIEVEFPWFGEGHRSTWAPIASLMAGPGRGACFMPEQGDEVLVAFEHGDFHHPFIVGFLWNGQDRPPTTDPHLRIIRSVNGHMVAIHDGNGVGGNQGYVRVEDAQGNMVEVANGRVSIQGRGTIEINAPGVIINGRPVRISTDPI